MHRTFGRARNGRVVRGAALLALLAGCSNSPSSGGGGQAGPLPALAKGCAQFQTYAGHSGTTVTMLAPIISPEAESLEKSWSQFEQCTGITISYVGSDDFEAQLPVRVSGGDAPDIALIPQPGLLQQMVDTGKVAKPPAQTVANEAKWSAVWKSYGSVDGTLYAAPMSAGMKSLVWYSPKYFAQNGYAVPTTWTGLMALSGRIAAAGKAKPWCGGIGSGTATGWPATDWLEEVVLGKYGGNTYDQWVDHQVKFTDPQIIDAMNIVQNWMHNPAWVNGGFGDVSSIATTSIQEAGLPILTGKCAMLQQASFYAAQWPAGTSIGPEGEIWAFHLPGVNPAIPTPVEGSGEFVTAFSSRPEVQAVQNYLSTTAWAESRIKIAPGWVSANQGVNTSAYSDPFDKLVAKYLTDSSATFRFDASDMMPAAIGTGQEWTSFTAWFAENQSVRKTAADIDAAWPH